MSVTSDRDFSGLYEQHLDFVWRNLRALGVPMTDVEDAAQDTFVVAYRRREDFRAGGSMRAWLYGIARRVAYRQRRGGGRRARLADAFATEPRESESLEGLAQTQQAWALALAALDALPAAQREAYWLTEFEGLTAAQAGAALGVSGNTISSRLRIARQALARHGEVLRARDEGELKRIGRPSAAQRRSAVAALAVRMGALSNAATTGIGSLGLWVGLAAGSLVVGSLVLGVGSADDEPRAAAPSKIAGTDAADVKEPAAATPRVAATAPATPKPAAAPPVPGERAATRRSTAHGPAAPALEPSSSLAAEANLVREIKAALRTDPARALKLVGQHHTRFPNGVLAAEALALRVDALCRLGREPQAKVAARALSTTHPLAVVAARGCPEERMTNPVGAGEEEGI